jgi:hypothetical protein
LKVSDENSRIRIRILIRIHTNMSWIRNTAYNFYDSKKKKIVRDGVGMSLKQMLKSRNLQGSRAKIVSGRSRGKVMMIDG